MKELETIIGLEVHAQINTKTKMFCSCDNDAWGKPANTTVCPVCMGHPGTLPVPNKAAIEKATQTSIALKCTITPESRFDRKNYFYPDLPSGYQISQYAKPIAEHGEVQYAVDDQAKTCRIRRLHMENDAGKLSHRADHSYVDFNRAGTPLMEIVTEPDLSSAQEASQFAQELRRILVAANTSEADMFKGMMRFDASISMRPAGEKKLYPRVEIKNLNSFKSLERALKYQEKILRDAWEEGKEPTGEITVGWLDDEERTVILRDKESAADYRYFPEPDIPAVRVTKEDIEALSDPSTMLPAERKAAYEKMGLTPAEATLLIDEPKLRVLFDAVNDKINNAKRASSMVLTQLTGFLKLAKKSINDAPSTKDMITLADVIERGDITGNAGKEVLEAMVESDTSPQAIIDERGLQQMDNDDELRVIIQKAIDTNPEAIASFKAGKAAALGAVVGWVMKESKGRANPGKVQEMLRKIAI